MSNDPTSASLTRRQLGKTALAAPFLSGAASLGFADTGPTREVDDPVRAAIEHKGRLQSDLARDTTRKPARVLDFFDIKPGMHVADMMAGDGYYSEILSRVVGPTGKVYCQNTKIPLEVFADAPLTSRLSRGGLDNVVRLDREFEDVGIPSGIDVALLVRFYHDFQWQAVDRAGFNALMFHVIKPGGVFGVVDHVANDGIGISAGKSLHRVEPKLVRGEIESAGFVLEAQSYVLSDPSDTHDWNIFEGSGERRDRTDRFVYFFRRPL